jgi:putative transcriptional regulator
MAKIKKEPSFAEQIIGGLTDFRDALRDHAEITERFTVRSIELDLEPEEYNPQEIKEIRESLKASQAIFARIMGVKTSTVQSWEQGRNIPKPIARRLLDEIRENKEKWINKLTEAAMTDDKALSHS